MEAQDGGRAGNDSTLGGLQAALPSSNLRSTQGVCMGSGIGSLEVQYDTSIALDEGVRLSYPWPTINQR